LKFPTRRKNPMSALGHKRTLIVRIASIGRLYS
jgi:hypothetical protein